jgi:hypothetical protein
MRAPSCSPPTLGRLTPGRTRMVTLIVTVCPGQPAGLGPALLKWGHVHGHPEHRAWFPGAAGRGP